MAELGCFTAWFVGCIKEMWKVGRGGNFFKAIFFINFKVYFHFLKSFDIELTIILIFFNRINPLDHFLHTIIQMLINKLKNLLYSFPHYVIRLAQLEPVLIQHKVVAILHELFIRVTMKSRLMMVIYRLCEGVRWGFLKSWFIHVT